MFVLIKANTLKLQNEKRGAELVLKSICEVYGKDVEQIIPELIQAPMAQIELIVSEVNNHNLQLTNITNKDISQNLCKLIEMCEQSLPKY